MGEEGQIIKFTSKMIIANQLQVHIDRDRKMIVMDDKTSDIKELQQLSMQYMTQIETLVKQNESLVTIMNMSGTTASGQSAQQPAEGGGSVERPKAQKKLIEKKSSWTAV